jgi:hypothetical protein
MEPNKPVKQLIVNYISDMGGCGYLRTIWPNEILNAKFGARKMYEGFYTSRFLVDKNILKATKAIHLQRQITDQQLEYIKWMRSFIDAENPESIMIYDMDDKIDCIPEYNQARNYFQTLNYMKNLTEIANTVNIFTVSTQHLADWITSLGCKSEVKVIPNLLPKYIYKPFGFTKPVNVKPRIVWAGSATHYNNQFKGDFEPIFDLISNTIDEFEWVFMGVNKLPVWLEPLAKKIRIIGWTAISNFPMSIKQVNADFGLAPLLDSDFNNSKSNIKMMDYWSSDVISIGSDVKPYKQSELFLKNNWKEDREQILNIFNDKVETERIIQNQNRKMDKFWLEDNLDIYMKMYGLKYTL